MLNTHYEILTQLETTGKEMEKLHEAQGRRLEVKWWQFVV